MGNQQSPKMIEYFSIEDRAKGAEYLREVARAAPKTKPRKSTKLSKSFFTTLIGKSNATVYRGFDENNQEDVAIKTITTNFVPEKNYETISREASLLLDLVHPNIVKLLEFKSTPSKYLLIMEFMDEGSLFNEVKENGRLIEPVAKEYLVQILEGLKYLHFKGILHRDLKCANILKNSAGKIKLTDFGSAKYVMDMRNSKVGTNGFIAPEVQLGEPYGYYADIWSLGCLTYEMLSGESPFFDKNVGQFGVNNPQMKKLKLAFPSHFSQEARDFIKCCLQTDPQKRWNVIQLIKHPFMKNKSRNAPARSKLFSNRRKSVDRAFQSSPFTSDVPQENYEIPFLRNTLNSIENDDQSTKVGSNRASIQQQSISANRGQQVSETTEKKSCASERTAKFTVFSHKDNLGKLKTEIISSQKDLNESIRLILPMTHEAPQALRTTCTPCIKVNQSERYELSSNDPSGSRSTKTMNTSESVREKKGGKSKVSDILHDQQARNFGQLLQTAQPMMTKNLVPPAPFSRP